MRGCRRYSPSLKPGTPGKLEYRWTFCLKLPGATTQVIRRGVNASFKPVIIYRRLGGKPEWLGPDFVECPPQTRQSDLFHRWGQGPDASDRLAARFVKPGMVVCDPFGGGGETALAAWRCGAHVTATDRDPNAAALAIAVTDIVTRQREAA